jgi:hypothetical protein
MRIVIADCAITTTCQRLELNSFHPVRKAEIAEALLVIGWGIWGKGSTGGIRPLEKAQGSRDRPNALLPARVFNDCHGAV